MFPNPDSVPEGFFAPEYDDADFGTVSIWVRVNLSQQTGV